jgi:hypothetical protein
VPAASPFLLPVSGVCWIAAGVLQVIAADPPRDDFDVVTLASEAYIPLIPSIGPTGQKILEDLIRMEVDAAAVAVTLDRIAGLRAFRDRTDKAEVRGYASRQQDALLSNLRSTGLRLARLHDTLPLFPTALDEAQQPRPQLPWPSFLQSVADSNPILNVYVNAAGQNIQDAIASAPRIPRDEALRGISNDTILTVSGDLGRLARLFGNPELAVDLLRLDL